MQNRSSRIRYRNIIAIISIIAGVLILFNHAILAITVAIYLIIKGVLDLISEN